MEILGFVLNVWGAILLGVFVIAMIIGVTFDRHGRESQKWWILFFGVVGILIWQWSVLGSLDWRTFFARDLWVMIGIYLAIGLGYSVLEFMLEVRRSARKWSERWALYKGLADSKTTLETTANSFVARHSVRDSHELVTAERNPDQTSKNLIVPRVHKGRLASFIGAWTIFWPFYAISLIIGDLLAEIFRVIADFITHISGRFVRMMFKDTFN